MLPTLRFSSKGPLPTAFRLFAKGVNETSKGSFLFDERSAQLVMDEYEKHGVDLMIDLEHLSMDQESKSYDPDARGWAELEIRNGELWATNVRWTPDGESRLREKRQRYISPTFITESIENNILERIISVFNVAICAMPATFDAPALVAASKVVGKKIKRLTIGVSEETENVNPELAKIAEALGLGEDADLEEMLKALEALKEAAVKAAEAPAPPVEDPETEEEEMAALGKLPPKLQAKLLAALGSAEKLRDLEKRTNESEVERMIAANADKIPAKLEPWARSQKPEVLREYLKHATPAVKASAEPKKKSEGDPEDVQLTDADREICKLSGRDPVKFLEHKKKLAAESAAREAVYYG